MNSKSVDKYVKQVVNHDLAELQHSIAVFADAFPALVKDLFFPPENFREVTVKIGNRGGYLSIAKIFDGTGEKAVIFANGRTPFEALMELDKRVAKNKWSEDNWEYKK